MSGTRTFLLELHCEEIPARFLKPLSNEMAANLAAFCKEISVSFNGCEPHFSPRKLSWQLAALADTQPDQTETQVGPPQRMCVDEAGNPTQTGLKFAEKWGVTISEVRYELPKGKKEPCAVVTVTRKGRPTQELLAEALPKLIAGLHVPKAMRWGSSDFEFVRPIRNILCLFGEEVVPIEVDGVKASASTWGHRLYHKQQPQCVPVLRPEDYEAALEKSGVVVSFDARRERLKAQMNTLAKAVGGSVVEDGELLDTLAEIVEFPTIVRGSFPADFLDLPKEVLVTSLKEHQKSFCIQGPDGALLPFFLASANRPLEPGSEAERLVAAGNEWVLKARLYDARFFFAEDRKTKLKNWLDKLSTLQFQKKLGSYLEKSERIVEVAVALATRLNQDTDQVEEAARLCKADLRTLMVGEFPELQGVMGGEYLMLEGAKKEIWEAVKEHYRPLGSDDDIPSTEMGCIVSLADKLDTVVSCIAVGLIPTGSKDPLALRRAGQGIVRILWEKCWDLDLMDMVEVSWLAVASKASLSRTEFFEVITPFLKDRVDYVVQLSPFENVNIRNRPGAILVLAQQKACKSAIAARWTNLGELKARCMSLFAFADDPRFASLAQSAKRIGNILKDEIVVDDFNSALLAQREECVLVEHLSGIEAASDVPSLLKRLADLADPLEAFFQAVMVKCEDSLLRAARLSLLHRLRKAFLRVADFSLWQ